MTKIAGSQSGSISQRNGSADPGIHNKISWNRNTCLSTGFGPDSDSTKSLDPNPVSMNPAPKHRLIILKIHQFIVFFLARSWICDVTSDCCSLTTASTGGGSRTVACRQATSLPTTCARRSPPYLTGQFDRVKGRCFC
jgi:hypothetical protein